MATHWGEVSWIAPWSSVSWQPLASAKYSKVCSVKDSPALVAATIPFWPGCLSLVAAARILSKVSGVSRPAFEQVLAVDQELGPGVAGDPHRLAVGLDQAERPLREGLAAQALDHLVGRVGVGQVVGGQVLHEAERHRAHHVGQGTGGAGRLDLGGQLVLGDGDDLHADAALLLEALDDRLDGGDPLGDVLGEPEGDGVVPLASSSLPPPQPAVASSRPASSRVIRRRGFMALPSQVSTSNPLPTRPEHKPGRTLVRRTVTGGPTCTRRRPQAVAVPGGPEEVGFCNDSARPVPEEEQHGDQALARAGPAGDGRHHPGPGPAETGRRRGHGQWLHGQAVLAFPQVADMEPKEFTRLLSSCEIALGTALLAIGFVPSGLAGLGLTAFGGSLTRLYLTVPGRAARAPVAPSQQGITLVRTWMLAIGAALVVDSVPPSRRRGKKKA